MTSKYKNLPDIDTAPDVFETPDEPETSLRPHDENGGDEQSSNRVSGNVDGIDGSELPDRRKAEKVFRSKKSIYTFRPQLPSLDLLIESDSETELSIPKETAATRLRRIKAELAQVEREMASSSSSIPSSSSDPSTRPSEPEGSGALGASRLKRKSVLPPREPVDLVTELASLRERLGAVDMGRDGLGTGDRDGSGWKRRLDILRSDEHGSTDVEGLGDEGPKDGGKRKEVVTVEGGPKLSELDERLAYLENLIGPPGGEGLDQNMSSPLLPTVTKLDHLLALLTQPRHLDVISRRIKLLLVDLDRTATSNRRAPSSTLTSTTNPNIAGPSTNQSSSSSNEKQNVTLTPAEYDTLQNLFNLLPRIDPLLPILPPLLARLRSLSTLHTEAGEVAEGLRRLQSDDRRFKEDVSDLNDVLKGVQNGLEQAAVSVERNWQGLEGRMKALEARMGELSS